VIPSPGSPGRPRVAITSEERAAIKRADGKKRVEIRTEMTTVNKAK